jgi:CRISPR-associated protein Cas2
MPERSFFVVVYDVADDKRRSKVAKYAESLGERVQKSVFEVYLTPEELSKMLKKMARLIHSKEDSVRVYDLCSACRGKIHSLGVGQVTAPPGLVIV